MILIHPHWQSTDDTNSVHIPIHQAAGSRRPAAILGISLVFLLGLLLVQNVRTLAGQLTESSLTVLITASGLEPASITLSPGALITWKNADTKPHILSSDALQTTDGLLYSTAIFPEEEFRATIAEQSSQGEYPYVSLTDPKISGTVRIEEKKSNPPPSSPLTSSLPINPLVAEMRSKPLQNVPPMASTSPSRSSPIPKPFRNPETGIPLGISAMASVVILLCFTRRIVRSFHAQVVRP